MPFIKTGALELFCHNITESAVQFKIALELKMICISTSSAKCKGGHYDLYEVIP